MSWIEVVDYKKANDELKNIYDIIIKDRGKLSNIMKVQGFNPEAMKAHLDLYLSIMFEDTDISREEREMIAVVVSSANNCKYCIMHHSEALKHYWKDREKVSIFREDYRSIHLSRRKRLMLDYAYKLTLKPEDIKMNDIIEMRNAGFSDSLILNLNLTVSYFNFVNRIASGLGVQYSENELKGYKF